MTDNIEEKTHNIVAKIRNDANLLFGKIFKYNSELLILTNNSDFKPSATQIFDFHITSHAISFLRDLYFDYLDSPAVFFNARCIIEGIAIKRAFEKGYFGELNLELLYNQFYIIERNNYKKFKDCYDLFLIPELLEKEYLESCNYFKGKCPSIEDSVLKEILNSNIPFALNSKLTFRKIIECNLEPQYLRSYSLLSYIIHPTSNSNLTCVGSTYELLNTLEFLKKEFNDLPLGWNLLGYCSCIYSSKQSNKFLKLIRDECTHFEKIEKDFRKNYKENYVSNTFHCLSMIFQEMASDALCGFSEQVKCKWKIVLEIFAGFYFTYISADNVEASYRLMQFHEDILISRSFGEEDKVNEAMKEGYKYYIEKYPNGVSYELFSERFKSTTGFTIDEKGNLKSLTSLVNDLVNLFKEEEKGISFGHAMRLNYLEAQMLSHSNGYLWFANSGAWGDINGIFHLFNQLMTFVCKYMNHLFEDSFKESKLYKDKKTANLLKHCAEHIIQNVNNLNIRLSKRTGQLFGDKIDNE